MIRYNRNLVERVKLISAQVRARANMTAHANARSYYHHACGIHAVTRYPWHVTQWVRCRATPHSVSATTYYTYVGYLQPHYLWEYLYDQRATK